MPVKVMGLNETVARIAGLSRVALAAGDTALNAGAEVVMERWKSHAPYVSGRYVDSIAIQPAANHQVAVQASVPYARRLEFGFNGADSLGRVYHQPPGNYAQTALESSRAEAIAAIAAALRGAL